MTIFGGVFALRENCEISKRTADELTRAISRHPGDQAALHTWPGCTIAYLDLNLLPGRGEVVDPSGTSTFLAGDILLKPRGTASRCDDLRVLHDAWMDGSDAPLRAARGSFAVVQVDPRKGTLRLAVDVLGARPLYVAFSDGFIYFATALRILESLTSLKKRMDLRGLLEMSAFGYPLSTRTQYEELDLLDGCEALRVDRATGVSRYKYWLWDELRPSHLAPDELSRALYTAFRDAVKWRLGDETSVVSLFSGGLDSRCVTASLLAEGVKVHSVNIAPEGSLDLVLGRQAAKHLGTCHFEFSKGPADGMQRIFEGHRAWLASSRGEGKPEFPSATWTGTGGSVGMGHVYVDDAMIALMQQGCRPAAVRAYLRKNRIELTPKPFQHALRRSVEACCFDGVLEQLNQHGSFDEGRRLHLFLMLNDQRRHLTGLYEDMDRNRLEMINPFFDTEFLRTVLASPVEPFLAHRLYNKWLQEFPFALDSVPWQAYDDHEPGPLPMPEGLRGQWEEGFYAEQVVKDAADQLLARSRAALSSAHFPANVLRGSALRAAWWATRVGVGDYSYLLKLASSWTDYASRAKP